MSRWTIEAARRWRLPRWRAPWQAPRRVLLDTDLAWDAGERHPGFEAWCRAHEGAACELMLSGRLLHTLLCDAELPLADDAATAGYARQLLAHYHGPSAQHWPMVAWSSGQRRGACALHGAEPRLLMRIARAHRVQLRSMKPWWALQLREAVRQLRALADEAQAMLFIVDGTLVTRIALRRAECIELQHHHLDAPTAQSLEALLQEHAIGVALCVAIGHGLDQPGISGVHVLGRLDGLPGAAA